MSAYRIPAQHVKGFKEFVQLSKGDREKIVLIVTTLNVGNSTNIADEISSQLGLQAEKSKQIALAITSLLIAKDRLGDSSTAFVKAIVEAFYNQTNEPRHDENELKLQLQQIVEGEEGFKLQLKARVLAFEREKLTENFRILTDLRPVFEDRDGGSIKGSVIIHSLRIDFIENATRQRAVFALDENDLTELSKLVQRAQEKQKALKKRMEGSGLNIIDISNG
ncbi:MAG: hypothetical protein WDO14_12155 [Bacteroidota bacterium]